MTGCANCLKRTGWFETAMDIHPIYQHPDVYRPPAGNLDQPVFTDVRGTIQRLNLDGKSLNVLSTKAGFMRSGDLHRITQLDFVFNGKLELWTREGDADVKRIYGPHSFITIPPHTPHLFNFLEDTVLAEWRDGPFEAWYYKPYRDLIEQNFKQKIHG